MQTNDMEQLIHMQSVPDREMALVLYPCILSPAIV